MSRHDFVGSLKTVGHGIGKIIKICGLVSFGTAIVAFRTFMRTVKSLFVDLFNIFAGMKNFFDLTKAGGDWWHWIVFVFKVPFVLVFNVIKYILTMTLGTLYNFIESIFMMVKYSIEALKGDGQVEVRELYKENYLENAFVKKSAGQSVLKDFALANIDINNCLTSYASSIKKMDFIQSVQKFFCVIGAWFLKFGSGHTTNTIQKYNDSLKLEFSNDNIEDQNNNIENKQENKENQDNNMEDKKENTKNIPISTVFGPYEVL